METNDAVEEFVVELPKIYYSAQTGGFYDSSVHQNIPEGAKEISLQERDDLLQEQSQGKVIVADSEGFPIAAAPAPPTAEQVQARLSYAVQSMLDAKARELGFDNIFTGVSYADESSVPSFQAHGQQLRLWRSLVWERCYEILAEVQAGTTPIPTAAALLAQLPQFGDN